MQFIARCARGKCLVCATRGATRAISSVASENRAPKTVVTSSTKSGVDGPPPPVGEAQPSSSTIGNGDRAAETLSAVQRMRAALQQQHEKCSSSSVATFRDTDLSNRVELLSAIVLLLEVNASVAPQVLAALSGDALRLLLIVATTKEYLGQEAVEAQLRGVAKDRVDDISSQEYNAWLESTVRERAAGRFMMPNGGSNVQRDHVMGYISWSLWRRTLWSAAVPFMAFGMLDNAMFVTVGDAIERSFSEAFGLSTMTTAALGGVVSGTAGIQVHGLAERLTQRSRVAQAPELSAAQRASASYGNATRAGSMLGMLLGLVLGMAPLLLLPLSSLSSSSMP